MKTAVSVAAESNIGEDYTNMFPFPENCDLDPIPESKCNQKVEVQAIEPTTTFGLLALGILGVASTFKRKQKSSKFVDKELEKVS